MDFDAFFGNITSWINLVGHMMCQDVCMEVKEQLAEDDFLVDGVSLWSHTCWVSSLALRLLHVVVLILC